MHRNKVFLIMWNGSVEKNPNSFVTFVLIKHIIKPVLIDIFWVFTNWCDYMCSDFGYWKICYSVYMIWSVYLYFILKVAFKHYYSTWYCQENWVELIYYQIIKFFWWMVLMWINLLACKFHGDYASQLVLTYHGALTRIIGLCILTVV